MDDTLPRIEAVEAVGPTTLHVRWRGDAPPSTIDLSEWISDGGAILAPLLDPAVFAEARVGHYDTAVIWGDEHHDLAIDADHLGILNRKAHRHERP